MEIHLTIDFTSPAVLTKLDHIIGLLKAGEARMSAELDTLTARVTETITVEESAIVLLNGLSAQISALKQDPAALQALADTLSSKSSELSAAILANAVPS